MQFNTNAQRHASIIHSPQILPHTWHLLSRPSSTPSAWTVSRSSQVLQGKSFEIIEARFFTGSRANTVYNKAPRPVADANFVTDVSTLKRRKLRIKTNSRVQQKQTSMVKLKIQVRSHVTRINSNFHSLPLSLP